MSYILDALKKSEEERHQGQVPNLGSNSTLIHSARPRAVVWPWIIAALLAINIFVLAYWFLTNRSASDDVSTEYEEGQVKQELISSNRSDKATHAEVLGPPLGAQGQTNVSVSSADASKGLARQVVNSDNQRVVSAMSTRLGPPVETAQPVPVSSEMRAEAKHTATESVVSETQHVSVEEHRGTTTQVEEESPLLIVPKGKSRPYTGPEYQQVLPGDGEQVVKPQTDTSASKQKGAEQTSTMQASNIQHITDKPHSFQLQIPDMAFNSHIFTNEPSSRRVMINNIYLKEGQSFSGMQVEQITEEGIILSLEGEPFKIGVLRDWYSPR